MKDLLNLVRAAIWLAFFGAIYQELKKPPAERTWHGRVAGVVTPSTTDRYEIGRLMLHGGEGEA